MNLTSWVAVISAVGLGGLIAKVLDIVWLQKTLQNIENKKWLREQRLRVYSKLATEIMSLGKAHATREDFFTSQAFVAEALLLVENKALAEKLEKYFTYIPNLYSKGVMEKSDVPEEELEGAYAYLQKLSKELMVDLRKSLQS
ncbi:MAG: hypothetical protein HOP25_02590 [Methylotenera sp.]|nr:hypothetical protein [Methylotenera sp.]